MQLSLATSRNSYPRAMRLQKLTPSGFTLVEMIVAMAILAVLIVTTAEIISSVERVYSQTISRLDEFREARQAYATLSRRINQATLNTYLDYTDAGGNFLSSGGPTTSFVAVNYARRSELRFISGAKLAGTEGGSPSRPTHSIFFQAPLGYASNTSYVGMETLLNTCGFYVEFNNDSVNQPGFFSNLGVPATLKYRFRLMELEEPSESLSLYDYIAANPSLKSSDPNGEYWFTNPLNANPTEAHVLADNIVALIILPKLSPADQAAATYTDSSLCPNYTYDSTAFNAVAALNTINQLPAVVQITMVAVSEKSFLRFQGSSTTEPNLGLATLFQNSALYATDLATLEQTLQNDKLDYTVFSTNVSIKAARWSTAQSGNGS